jgi:hypothetical protein
VVAFTYEQLHAGGAHTGKEYVYRLFAYIVCHEADYPNNWVSHISRHTCQSTRRVFCLYQQRATRCYRNQREGSETCRIQRLTRLAYQQETKTNTPFPSFLFSPCVLVRTAPHLGCICVLARTNALLTLLRPKYETGLASRTKKEKMNQRGYIKNNTRTRK